MGVYLWKTPPPEWFQRAMNADGSIAAWYRRAIDSAVNLVEGYEAVDSFKVASALIALDEIVHRYVEALGAVVRRFAPGASSTFFINGSCVQFGSSNKMIVCGASGRPESVVPNR